MFEDRLIMRNDRDPDEFPLGRDCDEHIWRRTCVTRNWRQIDRLEGVTDKVARRTGRISEQRPDRQILVAFANEYGLIDEVGNGLLKEFTGNSRLAERTDAKHRQKN